MKNIDLQNVIDDIKPILIENNEIIERIGIFGSLVKGLFDDNSDIDIAIEYKQGEVFEFGRFVRFCEVCESLRKNFTSIYNRNIDLIHVEDNENGFLNEIIQEVVWV